MTNKANLTSSAPHLYDPATYADLADWGVQGDAIAGQSHSSGRLLYKRPDASVGGNSPECGLWQCMPGKWRLSIPRDEFCHFVSGRATYVRDDGEIIEVRPGTCVHFPAGWSGICTVHETMRNVYMLR
ncbi:MAG TPA: cupin domain-containing protein [Dongiaceae bacterium]|jgi:hypothetical protein